MSDKIKELVNKVVLTGVITELEVKEGTAKATDKKPECPYVSVKGEIQFGTQKAQSRRFEAFVTKLKNGGADNGLYPDTLTFAQTAKSVAKVGLENATFISIQGSLEPNDYVNSQDQLKEGINIKATFFNEVDEFDATVSMNENLEKLGKAAIDIEGYIQNVIPETKGEDEIETGRLRMNLLSTNFFGDLVQLKNIVIPEDLAEPFQEVYEETQTATFYIDYMPNKAEKKAEKSGGIGKQRTTEGKTYLEMVVTGATTSVDEDDELGISTEAIGIAMKARAEMLAEIKEQGYQGKKGKGKGSRNGLASKPNPSSKPEIDDDDMPF